MASWTLSFSAPVRSGFCRLTFVLGDLCGSCFLASLSLVEVACVLAFGFPSSSLSGFDLRPALSLSDMFWGASGRGAIWCPEISRRRIDPP